MDKLWEEVFGSGKELNALQMCFRGLLVFIICWLLIRLSGRRSFGLKTPLDNVIVILLGTLLGRGVVGASPFVPIVAVSTFIVLLHRFVGWLMATNPGFSKIMEGEKILLFNKGNFVLKNMKSALVCKEDVLQGLRNAALTEDINKIEKIYIERNGEISPIKKEKT